MEIIRRFYLVFESMHQYVVDLKTFIQEVNEDIYIHQTLDGIFQDEEGKQMLVSCVVFIIWLSDVNNPSTYV